MNSALYLSTEMQHTQVQDVYSPVPDHRNAAEEKVVDRSVPFHRNAAEVHRDVTEVEGVDSPVLVH